MAPVTWYHEDPTIRRLFAAQAVDDVIAGILRDEGVS